MPVSEPVPKFRRAAAGGDSEPLSRGLPAGPGQWQPPRRSKLITSAQRTQHMARKPDTWHTAQNRRGRRRRPAAKLAPKPQRVPASHSPLTHHLSNNGISSESCRSHRQYSVVHESLPAPERSESVSCPSPAALSKVLRDIYWCWGQIRKE